MRIFTQLRNPNTQRTLVSGVKRKMLATLALVAIVASGGCGAGTHSGQGLTPAQTLAKAAPPTPGGIRPMEVGTVSCGSLAACGSLGMANTIIAWDVRYSGSIVIPGGGMDPGGSPVECFRNCDSNGDTVVNCDADPGNINCFIRSGIIAIHPGPPADNVGCNGSLVVGDNLGTIEGHVQSVADINTIVVPAGISFGSPDYGMAIDTTVVAYIYKDTMGNYWSAHAPQASTISVTIGAFSVTLPDDTGAHFLGESTPSMASGQTAVIQPCFTDGMALV